MIRGGTIIHGTTKHDTTVAEVSSGSYTGDGTQNRAIPHGLSKVPKLVRLHNSSNATFYEVNSSTNIQEVNQTQVSNSAVTAMDTTNFYVGTAVNFLGNVNLQVHTWVAIA